MKIFGYMVYALVGGFAKRWIVCYYSIITMHCFTMQHMPIPRFSILHIFNIDNDDAGDYKCNSGVP